MSNYRSNDYRYGDKSSYRPNTSSYERYPPQSNGNNSNYSRYGDSSSSNKGYEHKKDSIGQNLQQIQWDLSKLPIFEKNFYIEHPAVTSRPESFSDHWRKSKSIIVMGKGIPKVFYILVLHFKLFCLSEFPF